MKIIKGSVTSAKGFVSSGMHCGIKRHPKLDLALILSQVPATAAAVFTKNSIPAAPVTVSKRKIRNHKVQAVIVNSGNANCFTGSFGMLYAERSAKLAANLLNIPESDVMVASTGIIGKPLPYKKIQKAAPKLVHQLSHAGGSKTAKAILTTDTRPKEICVTLTLQGKKVTVGACAKGSGMIAPNMATMLAFITTDAAISAPLLNLALKHAVATTFNCITVDGCMSTNDMVLVMANGLANNKKITTKGKDFQKFSKALNTVCLDLAKKIVLDGEGGTKFLTITVQGAKSFNQAKTAGLMIANSNLVKTAAYGSNPNWGRVAAAVGSLGFKITEKELKIKFSSFVKKNIQIDVDLNQGNHEATVYTSDLSLEYVKINGRYN